jgi:tripartite-type tricarboxylate transporter receptor subunit TctC
MRPAPRLVAAPLSRRQTLAWLAGGVALAGAAPADARGTGRLVVTFPGGSPPDLLARALVLALAGTGTAAEWRVENHPGASGSIGAALVARAAADGTQLLVGAPATLAIASYVFERVPYDMAADFVPVAGIASGAQVLAVAAPAPVADFAAWRGLVQSRGQLARVGHSGIATSTYLQLRQWMQQATLPLVPVAYSGVGPIVRDLLGGHVDVYFGPIGGAIEALRAERLRALAVTGARRSPWLPQVPTLAELGQPEAIGALWNGVFAPAGEPAARIEAWSRALLQAQAQPAFAELLRQLALAPLALQADDFGQLVRADRERYAALVRTLGLQREALR